MANCPISAHDKWRMASCGLWPDPGKTSSAVNCHPDVPKMIWALCPLTQGCSTPGLGIDLVPGTMSSGLQASSHIHG